MPDNSEISNVSTFSTGGGGVTFERRVQLIYLVRMIIGGSVPCFDANYKICSTKFQARPKFTTDDMVLYCKDEQGKTKALLGQIKHKLVFTASDGEYIKTLQQAWDDFKGGKFKLDTDAFAIITGPLPSQVVVDTVKPIFEFARNSTDPIDFVNKVKGSKNRLDKYQVIRDIIMDYANIESDEELAKELWIFCKHLHLWDHDVDYSSQSRDIASTKGLIHTGLADDAKYDEESLYAILLEKISDYNQNGTVVSLKDLSEEIRLCFRSAQPASHDLDLFNFEPQSREFIGRTKDIEEVEQRLVAEDKKMIAIVGIGGVGKTYLAKQVLVQAKDIFKLRVWFNASSEAQLEGEYRLFAESLNKDIEGKSIDSIRQIVKAWFNHQNQWLIVFDDVGSLGDIKKFLPTDGGKVIITSRNLKAFRQFKIELKPMLPDDSVALLSTNIDSDEVSPVYLSKMAEQFAHLPLALMQSAAYISNVGITIEKYLTRYEQYKRELLSQNALEEHIAVYFTWDTSIEYIQGLTNGSNIAKLLKILACFQLECPRNLLISFADKDEFELDSYLSALSSLCLVSLSRGMAYIHPVMVTVIIEKMKEQGDFHQILRDAAALIISGFNYQRDSAEAQKLNHKAIPVVKNLLEIMLSENLDDMNIVLISYRMGLIYLDHLSEYKLALKYLQIAYGKGVYPDTKIGALDLDTEHRIKRQLAKAYAINNINIELSESLLSTLPDSIDKFCDLANLYMFKKGYIEYPKLEFTSIEQIADYSEDAEDLTDDSGAPNKIARLPSRQVTKTNIEAAGDYLEQALTFCEGEDSDKARVLHMQGTIALAKRSYVEAITFYSQALAIKQRVLEENHLEVSRTLYQLGKSKFRLYKLRGIDKNALDALKHLEQALGIKQKFYGTYNRADILLSLFNIIQVLQSYPFDDKSKKIEYYLSAIVAIKKSQTIEYSYIWPKIAKILLNIKDYDRLKIILEGCNDKISKELLLHLPQQPGIEKYLKIEDKEAASQFSCSHESYGRNEALEVIGKQKLKDSILGAMAEKHLDKSDLIISPIDRAIIESKGFSLQQVSRDGDCLFHAVIDQLNYNLINREACTSPQQLRELAVEEIISNMDFYQGFMDADANFFIEKLLTPGEWADNVIIAAIAQALNVKIFILRSDKEASLPIQPREIQHSMPPTEIHLYYHVGIHYDSLHMSKTAGNKIDNVQAKRLRTV